MATGVRTDPANMVKIDGEKLYKEIRERGLTTVKLCKDLGVNSGYFSNAKYRGAIANLAVVALESRYGIMRDSYIIKEEDTAVQVVEVVKEKETDFFSEENMQKFYQVIYSAVYEAVKKAWSE